MLLELILALICGIAIGTITGLLPGIHINLVSIFLLSIASLNLPFLAPIILIVFIVSMSITHTFLDFIPSIYLGAPDSDTGLSVLPGHKLLLEGKGHEALTYTIYGCLIGIIIILLATPIFIFILPSIFYYLKFVMFLILISASLYLIVKEKNSKLSALLVFFLSGFLGLATLNLPLKESLLPLLSGLFGSSSLITSILKKQTIPKQASFKKIKIKFNEIKTAFLASSFAAPLCSFLPAIGSSQAAVIGSDIIGETKQQEFLMLLGSINIIIMGLSFVTLYSIQKARTGAAAAVSQLLPSLTLSSLLIILAAIIFSSIFAFFLASLISKIFARNISRINYSILSIFILIFLALMVIIFSGFLGFLIFLVATFTGLVAIYLNVRRTHLMGSMMLTSILFYLP